MLSPRVLPRFYFWNLLGEVYMFVITYEVAIDYLLLGVVSFAFTTFFLKTFGGDFTTGAGDGYAM